MAMDSFLLRNSRKCSKNQENLFHIYSKQLRRETWMETAAFLSRSSSTCCCINDVNKQYNLNLIIIYRVESSGSDLVLRWDPYPVALRMVSCTGLTCQLTCFPVLDVVVSKFIFATDGAEVKGLFAVSQLERVLREVELTVGTLFLLVLSETLVLVTFLVGLHDICSQLHPFLLNIFEECPISPLVSLLLFVE